MFKVWSGISRCAKVYIPGEKSGFLQESMITNQVSIYNALVLRKYF